MLAKEVINKYGTRAQLKVEDLGASEIADRFGVDKSPAFFVDGALVARPEDFYAWGGPETGRYLTWSEVASRRRFQSDLQRMIDIRLSGGNVPSVKVAATGPEERHLPDATLVDLQGRKFTLAQLRGKPTIVEFWATWCPPCLDSLNQMKRIEAGKANIVAIAIESDRKQVDKLIEAIKPPARVAMGTDELRKAFDGPPAVPTLLLADRTGKIVKVFYGAPPDMHQQIERELEKL